MRKQTNDERGEVTILFLSTYLVLHSYKNLPRIYLNLNTGLERAYCLQGCLTL